MPEVRCIALGIALLALAVGPGCGGASPEGETTPDAEEGAQAFDDDAFLAGCQDGCGGDEPMCERYCSCSLREVHASPEVMRAVLALGTETDDAGGQPEVLTHLIAACGEEFYAHHFVAGCVEGCTAEGRAAETCAGRCECLYATLRARHPGREGLAYLSTVYGSPTLPAEAVEEIELVRPACGF